MPQMKMYRDPDVQCPVGHVFSVIRRTSSMGKYVSTFCPYCQKHFRGYACVVVSMQAINNRIRPAK